MTDHSRPSSSQPFSPPPSALTPSLVMGSDFEPDLAPPPPPIEDELLPSASTAPLTSRLPSHSNPLSSTSAQPKPSRRSTLSFSLPLFFRPSTSSPSSSLSSPHPFTAEGWSIPVDDSAVANRMSALREFNDHSPSAVSSRGSHSRRRYVESTGAHSSTNSAPIIVRAYPPPASPDASPHRPQVPSIVGIESAVPSPSREVGSQRQKTIPANAGAAATAASVVRRVLPLNLNFSSAETPKHGLVRMTTIRPRKRGDTKLPDAAKLPPIEAFSFKSFMSNMEAQNPIGDINASLDRIAEICARSRYSLSNQYEVHYAPHGPGTSFNSSPHEGLPHHHSGLTPNSVPSDDEASAKRQRKRSGRRRIRAVGTLETIMSASRSSDEDKSKKKPAADIAAEIRERVATEEAGEASASIYDRAEAGEAGEAAANVQEVPRSIARKRSTSFATALLDSNRNGASTLDVQSPRSSAALLSDPSHPQASTSHLEIRTEAEDAAAGDTENSAISRLKVALRSIPTNTQAGLKGSEPKCQDVSKFSGLGSWMPWRGLSGSEIATANGGLGQASEAENRLRDLLRISGKANSSRKGKSVDRPS